MAGLPYFGFMDESGVLVNDPNQPIFSLGLLLMEDTSRITNDLVTLKSQAIASLGVSRNPFEFKFNSITRRSRIYYERLIDIVMSYQDARVCVFILDKNDPKIDPTKYFNSTWDAYISYAKLILSNNITKADSTKMCTVLADYITKPRKNPIFLESALRSVPSVINAALLESHASLMIQMIDVLAGAVVYGFKKARGYLARVDSEKDAVRAHLAHALAQPTLAQTFTAHKPIYFSVWPFHP